MGEQNYRLQLRLGIDHEIARQYSDVRDKALGVLSDTSLEKEEPIDQTERERLGDLVAEMREAANLFLKLATEYLAANPLTSPADRTPPAPSKNDP
jgi:hypothetical protein